MRRRLGMRCATKIILGTLLVALMPCALTATADGSQAEARRAGSLRLSSPDAMPGELFWVRGEVPSDGKRPVVLQRRYGDSWKRVARDKSQRDGRFGFYRYAPVKVGASRSFRVTAPAVHLDGQYFGPVVTPSARIVVVRQTASLTTNRTEVTSGDGQGFLLTGEFHPIRPYRIIMFQERVDGQWTFVNERHEGKDGVAKQGVSPGEVGTYTYRAVALSSRYEARKVTNSVEVQVLPPPSS